MSSSPIDINNRAVVEMHHGLYDEAIARLTQAVSILKRYMQDLIVRGERRILQDNDDDCRLLFASFYGNGGAKRNDTDENEPFIHTNGICLDSPLPAHKLSIAALHAIGRVVVANLAIAHHLRAILTRPHASCWRLVLSLYDSSVHSLQGSRQVAVAIAIYNNLGTLYRQLGDDHRAEACHGQMLSMVMAIDSSQVPNLDGILRTASPLIFRSRVPPAAAA